jgi:uncharacterized protein YegL
MTDISYTHISVLSDKSGSMEQIRADAEGGINAFVHDQQKTTKKIKGGRATLTLVEFANTSHYVYDFVDLAEVPDPAYRLNPSGETALVESMIKLIDDTGRRLANLPEAIRPGAVLFVVTTDGEENASGRDYTSQRLKKLVTRQTNKFGWKFIFLAANQDAFAVADAYGFNRGSTLNYAASAAGTHAAYASTSGVTSSYRTLTAAGAPVSVASASLDFAEDDRDVAASN